MELTGALHCFTTLPVHCCVMLTMAAEPSSNMRAAHRRGCKRHRCCSGASTAGQGTAGRCTRQRPDPRCTAGAKCDQAVVHGSSFAAGVIMCTWQTPRLTMTIMTHGRLRCTACSDSCIRRSRMARLHVPSLSPLRLWLLTLSAAFVLSGSSAARSVRAAHITGRLPANCMRVDASCSVLRWHVFHTARRCFA